jgi:hypothetical protein
MDDQTRLLTELGKLTDLMRRATNDRERVLKLCLDHPTMRGVDIAKAAGITEQAVTGRRRKIERESPGGARR